MIFKTLSLTHSISVISKSYPLISKPSFFNSENFSSVFLKSQAATFAPLLAKPSTIACPIPPAAPVTTTTLSLKHIFIISLRIIDANLIIAYIK